MVNNIAANVMGGKLELEGGKTAGNITSLFSVLLHLYIHIINVPIAVFSPESYHSDLRSQKSVPLKLSLLDAAFKTCISIIFIHLIS